MRKSSLFTSRLSTWEKTTKGLGPGDSRHDPSDATPILSQTPVWQEAVDEPSGVRSWRAPSIRTGPRCGCRTGASAFPGPFGAKTARNWESTLGSKQSPALQTVFTPRPKSNLLMCTAWKGHLVPGQSFQPRPHTQETVIVWASFPRINDRWLQIWGAHT